MKRKGFPLVEVWLILIAAGLLFKCTACTHPHPEVNFYDAAKLSACAKGPVVPLRFRKKEACK